MEFSKVITIISIKKKKKTQREYLPKLIERRLIRTKLFLEKLTVTIETKFKIY